MRTSPSLVPRDDDDREVYLVLDDFGPLGQAWRETEPERTDLATVIGDMLDGQYSDPVRIVCFNTSEGWARDVSEDIADALRQRCELARREPPGSIKDFIERFEETQLRLRFA